MRKRGGGGGSIMQVVKKFLRVCACNYSGTPFSAPTLGLIPGPSLVPGPAGYWGDELRG